MPNDYYTAASVGSAHSKARASAVNAQLQAVASGLDKLPSEAALKESRFNVGTDSGAANAYVVAMTTAPAAYTLGQAVVFVATYANTGASTVNVSGLGAKSIIRWTGDALQSGDIPAGGIIEVRYDGTSFRLMNVLTTTPVGLPLAVSQGGTGQTTAATALNALGFATYAKRVPLNLNGDFQINQRGGTFAVSDASDSFLVDMWRWVRDGSSGVAATVSRDTDVPTGYAGYSLKVDCTTIATTGAALRLLLSTYIEAADLQRLGWGTAGAKPLGIRFAIKSPKSGTHCLHVYQPDDARSYVVEFTVASADTWEWITLAIPGDTTGVIDNDAGTGLRIGFPLIAGADYQAAADAWAAGDDSATSNQQNLLDNTANNLFLFDFSVVELESVSDEIGVPHHLAFGEALRRCWRYYIRWPMTATDESIESGYCGSTTILRLILKHLSQMRAAPTMAASAGDTFKVTSPAGTFTGSSISFSDGGPRATTMNVTIGSASLTAGAGGHLRRDGTDTTYIEASAELV